MIDLRLLFSPRGTRFNTPFFFRGPSPSGIRGLSGFLCQISPSPHGFAIRCFPNARACSGFFLCAKNPPQLFFFFFFLDVTNLSPQHPLCGLPPSQKLFSQNQNGAYTYITRINPLLEPLHWRALLGGFFRFGFSIYQFIPHMETFPFFSCSLSIPWSFFSSLFSDLKWCPGLLPFAAQTPLPSYPHFPLRTTIKPIFGVGPRTVFSFPLSVPTVGVALRQCSDPLLPTFLPS